MNLIKRYLLVLFFLPFSNLLISQDLIESPLNSNAILIQKWNELQAQSNPRSASIADTIDLDSIKFLDDFSYDGPYPDTAFWLDNFVYINRGYPIAPITIGAATFDGLGADGYPYNFLASPTSSGKADYLTSKPIDLNKPAIDSIYLSFYYQPQGRGNPPEAADSLILEFKALDGWKHIWAKKGSTLASTDSSWTLVKIAIKDSIFLYKGFQFRFRNYATLTGNLDHWSIDDVYLNKTRSYTEKRFDDIAFVYNGSSILKSYRQMPWKHYSPAHLATKIDVQLRNNYVGSNNNINYTRIIRNENTSAVIESFSGSIELRPFDSTHVYTECDIALGCIKTDTINKLSSFPSLFTAPTTISVQQYISSSDFNPLNDTLTVRHKFSNYYAYDDGSAESTFGLSVLNSLMAEKFTSTVKDTLRYIDIYFNPAGINAELYSIRLKVWADNGGVPGIVLYTGDSAVSPFYNSTGPNQFSRFYLKTPLVLPAITFYIGFEQNTNQLLNIGVDKNTNTQNKILYNVSGTWNNPPYTGSLMMHPVFGSSNDFVGIADAKEREHTITVYPNPANDKLYVKQDSENSPEKISYAIIDIFGRTVIEKNSLVSGYIDISTLSEGVYFIRVINNEYTSTTKFIKVN